MDTYENEIYVVSSSSEYDTKSYMAWKALYSFFHNLGFDYKNLKVSGWIKDKTTGFVMPWYPDSNYDAGIEFNNYGFHIDECQFNVRTPSTLMRFKDCDNVARSYNSNVSLILQAERIF